MLENPLTTVTCLPSWPGWPFHSLAAEGYTVQTAIEKICSKSLNTGDNVDFFF